MRAELAPKSCWPSGPPCGPPIARCLRFPPTPALAPRSRHPPPIHSSCRSPGGLKPVFGFQRGQLLRQLTSIFDVCRVHCPPAAFFRKVLQQPKLWSKLRLDASRNRAYSALLRKSRPRHTFALLHHPGSVPFQMEGSSRLFLVRTITFSSTRG